MQRERFGYKQGIIGCEWAIIAPIVVSLLFALIGVIYCNANGLQADALNSNAVFMTLASAFTELSFLVVALCIAWRSKTNFVAGVVDVYWGGGVECSGVTPAQPDYQLLADATTISRT